MGKAVIANEVVTAKGADETGPQPVATSNDPIAPVRALGLPRQESIPDPPAAYRSPGVDDRRRLLRSLDEDLIAETILALQELAALGPKALADDLGPAANDVRDPGQVASDLVATDKLLAKLARVTEFVATRRAVAASDAVRMLDAVVEEVDHRARRDPSLRDRYAATYKVVAARSAKISEGVAAAKAAKTAKKPA